MSAEPHSEPLRAFVESSDRDLFRFCAMMSATGEDLEPLVVQIFRTFARNIYRNRRGFPSTAQLQIELFRTALRILVNRGRGGVRAFSAGRDTRQSQELEKNLLAGWRNQNGDPALSAEQLALLGDRLRLLDFDLRSPVLLHDLLGVEAQLILQILGLRWGAFRHRLHRGRVELQWLLQGYGLAHSSKGDA